MRVCKTWYVVILYVLNELMTAARSVGGPADTEMIEEMDRELTKVIEDFDRAVIVESLRLVNEIGELSFSQPVDSCSSRFGCRASRASASRARVSVQTASACRDRLSAQPLLHGRHPPISSQSNHGLGSQ